MPRETTSTRERQNDQQQSNAGTRDVQASTRGSTTQSGGQSSRQTGQSSGQPSIQPGTQPASQQGQQSADRERDIARGHETSRGTGMTTNRPQRGTAMTNRQGSPFALMQRMAEDMDRLFDHFGLGRTGFMLSPSLGAFGDEDLWSDSALTQTMWTPPVEIAQRGDKLVVRADLPGVDKDDLHLEVQNDVLSLSGERREQREERGDGFYRSERRYGRFSRAIPLPEGINPDEVEATFDNGVLEVTLPAPTPRQSTAKRVTIR